MTNLETIQISIGLIGLIISILIAVVQTVRLKNLRRIRDTHLHLIWKNAKELSSRLHLKTEEEYPRKACGVRAQRIEELVATLIVNLSNINRKTIDKWYENGEIDDYDYDLLKKLTR